MPLFDPNIFHPQVFDVGQFPLGIPTFRIVKNSGFEGQTPDHRGRTWNRHWIFYDGNTEGVTVKKDSKHQHYGKNCIMLNGPHQGILSAEDWLEYWRVNFPFAGQVVNPNPKSQYTFLHFSVLFTKKPEGRSKVTVTLNFTHSDWSAGGEAPYDGKSDPVYYTYCDDVTWASMEAEEKNKTIRLNFFPEYGVWCDCERNILEDYEDIYGRRPVGLGACGHFEGYDKYHHLEGAREWRSRNYDLNFIKCPTFLIQVGSEGLGGAKFLLDDIQIRDYDWNPYPTEKHWSPSAALTKPGWVLSIIESSSNRLIAGGVWVESGVYHPVIWKSDDGGTTWTMQEIMPSHPGYPMLTDVMEDSDGNLWCSVGVFFGFMGVYGGIFKSIDDGDTWVRKSVGIDKGFYGITEANDGSLFAVEGESLFAFSSFIVHRSNDGGETWNVVFHEVFSALGGAKVLQDNNGDYFIAVSRFAYPNYLDIYKSTDGDNWVKISSIPDAIQCWKGILYQTSDGTYWTSCYPYAKLFKSPDAISWEEEPIGNLGDATDLTCMLELSGGEYFIGTFWGEVWKKESGVWSWVGINEAKQIWDLFEGPSGIYAGILNNDIYTNQSVFEWKDYTPIPRGPLRAPSPPACEPSPVGNPFHEASENLLGEAVIQRSVSVTLLGEFEVAHWKDLLGETIIQNSDSQDLLVDLIIKHETIQDLLGKFIVKHEAFQNLLGESIIRNDSSALLLGESIIRNEHSVILLGKFIIRHDSSQNLLGETLIRNESSAELLGEFETKHETSQDLLGEFWVRSPWPLWTNRHLLNGVVELEEKALPDAILEYIIRGVMNDIKSRLINEGIVAYRGWTDISKTPKMIRRATTYGAVATLYARGIEITGIIAGIRPVVYKAMSERKMRERAMDYWEERMEKAITIYISSSTGIVMVVDTEDEEPVFSMEDIPLYRVEDPL